MTHCRITARCTLGTDGLIRDAVRADFRISRHEDFVRRSLALQPPGA